MRQLLYTMFITNNGASFHLVKGKFGKTSKPQNIMKMIVNINNKYSLPAENDIDKASKNFLSERNQIWLTWFISELMLIYQFIKQFLRVNLKETFWIWLQLFRIRSYLNNIQYLESIHRELHWTLFFLKSLPSRNLLVQSQQ